jgi:hypothetical protein
LDDTILMNVQSCMQTAGTERGIYELENVVDVARNKAPVFNLVFPIPAPENLHVVV